MNDNYGMYPQHQQTPIYPQSNRPYDDLSIDPSSLLVNVANSQITNMFIRPDFTPNNVSAAASNYFSEMKYYFDVNTSYVANKLKLILFPLRHKSWNRRIIKDDISGQPVYLSPRDDINAPDLYIPLMACVTYILLYGFIMGTNYNFTPETLATTATKVIAFLVIEVIILKGAFYFLPNPKIVPLPDLVAYSGYKFVGIVLNSLVGFFLGNTAMYVIFLITSLFTALFMVKTFRLLVLADGYDYTQDYSNGNQRNYFLFFAAVLQFLICFCFVVV